MSGRGELRVRDDLVIPAPELQEAATRSSGPGGQHVNKTSTRVTLRWNVASSECLTPYQKRRLQQKLAARLTRRGDLIVNCDRTRSRARNREHARARIVEIVSGALARRLPRRPTKPTRASRVRRLEAKNRRGTVKSRRGAVAPDSD